MNSEGYHDQKASFGPKKAPRKYDLKNGLFKAKEKICVKVSENISKIKKIGGEGGFFDFSEFLLILGLNTKLHLFFSSLASQASPKTMIF
jgi:hypothetical protein